MDTSKLKKFAQFARRTLIGQVSAKLASVLAEGAAARREHPETVKTLEAAIAMEGKGQVIERVAYIWFNRFCALRYMDVNDLNPVRVVSPLVGQFQPEILTEAKAGNIDENRVPEKVRVHLRALLDGRAPSQDPQAEAYRVLLVALCNDWHKAMPFLFERIDDYTELLLPEDLLSNSSVLAYTREAMTPDVCQDVEVIGWLYQFYISEKKDEVFAGLKKNQKITAESIPAATQLFTPHWIVRYLVENSLGRLWMLNRPNSKLAAQMDYYIAPEEPENDFLRVSSPEQIRICDPACGSGHMLTYAFDLLCAIYEEEGYDPAEIPEKILAHNLYGIEIDDRAGALAAFALVMKAAGRRKRFLRRPALPNICVLENVIFKDGELSDYVTQVGSDLFTADLRETLGQFAEAKNFGSLIVPKLKDVTEVARVIADKQFEGNLFLRDVHARVQTVLEMADYLAPKYHVVVANPPYMGGKGMNPKLGAFVKGSYPDSRADLFAIFMERALALTYARGVMAMINMQSWMFLSTFEKLRTKLLSNSTLLTMAHLGERAFDSIGGAVVSTTAFVFENAYHPHLRGNYIRLTSGGSETEKSAMLLKSIENRGSRWLFKASAADFSKVPGSPVAYWLTDRARDTFVKFDKMSSISTSAVGQNTGDNDRFLKYWFEVSEIRSDFECSDRDSTFRRDVKWYPYNKGGGYRKWYGNFEYLVNWQNDAEEIKKYAVERNDGKHWSRYVQNLDWLFHEGVTWSDVTTGRLAARYLPKSFISDVSGHCAFFDGVPPHIGLSVLNSKFSFEMARVLNPTIHFQAGNYRDLPYSDKLNRQETVQAVSGLVSIAKSDWDAYEASWDFTTLPLLASEHRVGTLAKIYAHLRAHWRSMTEEMQRLEEENNRVFIEAYGLQGELTAEVPLEEITLTCNPAYRYGGKKTEAELEDFLRADTMREFLSYAVGCMFGRYSLDAPGLILANQGEGMVEYLTKVPSPSFAPDADNVIPMLDGDWFADDIAARFRKFLRVTFGDEHFQENLDFIEEALDKDIRKYFIRDFFNDHVKRYKKRPIYWLFSSPRGTFNALIYMHRYRPDTVSVVLNDYLREFRSKLEAHRRAQQAVSISGDASPAQKTKALKEIEATGKQIEELDAWERAVLFPLATQRLEIDLDDGVKANYPKLGEALKTIPGLEAKDD
ncbi:BREX-1 system adenine-specific DNA-methyltransferase PglX [Mesorhizobium sp. M0933]|uniref:BREX-1 system adenine-specific DNA-methyltransferase PglX n=1 Tax=Mesorhizobium sp. M0933 TaxID=2957030 RepID=UPI003337F6F7